MSVNCKVPDCQAANVDAKECRQIKLNVYTVTRIVYEVIKTYMLANTPDAAGIRLNQTYDADPTKSQILLDISYNWRTRDMSKVPAIFVQRGDATFKTLTFGQKEGVLKNQKEQRFAMCTLPVIVTCIAAEPLAVVENLAEYIKQPLLYFRDEVQLDFGIRRFELVNFSRPVLTEKGKNNFFVDLTMNVVFDDSWVVQQEQLKLKHIGVELFDALWTPLQTLDI